MSAMPDGEDQVGVARRSPAAGSPDAPAASAERDRKRLKADRREKKRSRKEARHAAEPDDAPSVADGVQDPSERMTDAQDVKQARPPSGHRRHRDRGDDADERLTSRDDGSRGAERDQRRGRSRDRDHSGRDTSASPGPDRERKPSRPDGATEESVRRQDRSRDAQPRREDADGEADRADRSRERGRSQGRTEASTRGVGASDRAGQRDRDRDRERDRERDRGKDKGKDRGRDRSRGRSQVRDAADSGRKRERGREDGEARSRERHRDKRPRDGDAKGDGGKWHEAVGIVGGSAAATARDDAAREAEAKQLEVNAEKQRKRAEAWQKLQRQKAAAADAAAEAQPAAKKWSFEDDDDDEDQPAAADAAPAAASAAAPSTKPPPGGLPRLAAANGADDEDVDPLDAFMAENNSAAAAQAASQQQPEAMDTGGEDEVDPLDAFMAGLPSNSTAPAASAAPAQPAPAATAEQPAAAGGTAAAAAATAAAATVVKTEPTANGQVVPAAPAAGAAKLRRPKRYYESDESSDGDEKDSSDEDDEAWARNVQAGKLSKGDRLGPADHSKIDYLPFRRNFYIEVPELARMTEQQVAERRKELDGIKVRGKNVPRPVRSWNQCGLASRVVDTLRKAGMTEPMPIQAQALPIIMSGRDCIGVAKTGSGKTLAFVLPMLRHIKDQPPLGQGDGPIALIMAPTRELVQQIGKEIRRFTKPLGLMCTCIYGGSGVANQITELKRGTEVVVCTAGRMIDILVTSAGKITNLRRVTYLVLDEADRMFDMGFEPQINRIVNNIRPDRQTVLFSATFPRQVEALARAVLQAPVEIQVGGRSTVNADITQLVEIREEDDRFLRLLEVLGLWYEKGKVLIFVQSQEKCDTLFRDLLKSGYPCLSLHGGKDQSDRESTIADFKSNVCNVLVATSVAARGLDVKDLVLVVNYDVPNHHEDYVHRVGRTGRAGAKGTAITFISPAEDRYAPDLVKALKESGVPVPKDLEALAEGFTTKRKAGTAQAHGSGFGGSGFKFDAAEEQEHKAERKGLIKEYGIVEQHDSDDEDKHAADQGQGQGQQGAPLPGQSAPTTAEEREAAAAAAANLAAATPEVRAQIERAQALAAKLSDQTTVVQLAGGIRKVVPTVAGGAAPPPSAKPAAPAPAVNPLIAAAQAAAQKLAAQAGMSFAPAAAAMAPAPAAGPDGGIAAAQRAALLAANPQARGLFDPTLPHYEADLEINDFPQHARWKITHRDTMADVTEQTGAAVVTRGIFIPPGQKLPEGERKLGLLIQGPTESCVKAAKAEIKRILEDSTERAMRREAGAGGVAAGRYSIV